MIVLLAAVVAVCAGVVVVAVGRGGQIAEFVHDAPPLGLPGRRPIAGTDVALLRLPAGPWGYSFRATDDALRRIAHALTERDTRIAVLEQQVSELRTTGTEKRPASGESPWFDRESAFEPRPGRALPSPARDAIAASEPEVPGRMPMPPEPAPQDDPPQDDLQDDVPEDDPPQDAAPGIPAEPDAAPATSHDTTPPSTEGDTAPREEAKREPTPEDDHGPEAVAAGAAAATALPGAEPEADAPEESAATPGPATDDTPEPASPGASAAAPAAPAAADSDVDDEDWAFEDDVEPVVAPIAEVAPPKTPVRPARPRKRTPAPAPGDRLVASTNPQADDETTTDDEPHGEED